MLNFTKLSLPFFHARIWKPDALSIKALTSVFLFITLLLSGTTLAQTSFDCPAARRCTSNDLEVVGAFITGLDQCLTCTPGQEIERTITLIIDNHTGSTRTSFALFGTFVHGTTSEQLFICGGPIAPSTQTLIVSTQTIKFICGEELKITNSYLAWTDASGGAKNSCEALQADNCKGIAPKCGIAAELVIAAPLTGSVTNSFVPCIGDCDGSITVTAEGGKAPFTYKLGTTSIGPTDGSATFNNLCADNYTVTIVDANECETTVNYTLPDKPCCVAPPIPTVCETPAGLCGDGKASLTISNAVVGDTYYLTQGTTTTSQVATSAELTFTGLTPGADFSVYGENVVGDTKCKGDAADCDDLTGTCSQQTAVAKPSSTVVESINAKIESKTKVIAAPNPFNDKIRFFLQSGVSGQGSLELYNLMGQRVKTVFQGYVEAGRIQNIEYSVPGSQRSNLIYVFTVGNQKTSGKLIGLR